MLIVSENRIFLKIILNNKGVKAKYVLDLCVLC